jgi:hypothetical protein
VAREEVRAKRSITRLRVPVPPVVLFV